MAPAAPSLDRTGKPAYHPFGMRERGFHDRSARRHRVSLHAGGLREFRPSGRAHRHAHQRRVAGRRSSLQAQTRRSLRLRRFFDDRAETRRLRGGGAPQSPHRAVAVPRRASRHARRRRARSRSAGQGTPVDWLVEMVRFDQDTLFDRLAERHQLDAGLMEGLADAIVRLHAGAEPRPDHGGRDGMAWVIDGNARGFVEQGATILEPAACERLIRGRPRGARPSRRSPRRQEASTDSCASATATSTCAISVWSTAFPRCSTPWSSTTTSRASTCSTTSPFCSWICGTAIFASTPTWSSTSTSREPSIWTASRCCRCFSRAAPPCGRRRARPRQRFNRTSASGATCRRRHGSTWRWRRNCFVRRRPA